MSGAAGDTPDEPGASMLAAGGGIPEPPRQDGRVNATRGDVLCEVRDLYYGIDIPAGDTGSGRDANGWKAKTANVRRALKRMQNVISAGTGRCSAGGDSAGKSEQPTMKALLRGVSCRVRAGEMVAVIGASGAGKSTFLDLLAGRKQNGECAGHVLLASGDTPVNDGARSGRASVYVRQEDYHVAELTVRESLSFAVSLSMGARGVTDQDRRNRVNELLTVLGLESCADVRVGNPLERGISGGQARRLSVGIGVANLESVRLLLLDEPTTGLDSTSAKEVLQLARRLSSAADRRAVVASVHQPSAEMFALFDKVLVLVDGRQAYFGPASKACAFLSRPEVGMIPAPGQNPAEFILLAAQGDRQGVPERRRQELSREFSDEDGETADIERYAEEKGRAGDEESKWDGAARASAEMEAGVDGEEGAGLLAHAGDDEAGGVAMVLRRAWRGQKTPYAVGFWAQVSAVWRRAWKVQLRRTDALWALIVKNTFVGVLTAAVFWQEAAIGTDEPLVDPLLNDVTPAASNVMGLLYFGTLYGLTGHLQAIPNMFAWKRHFIRERDAGMYSTTVYWLVSSTVFLPVIFGGFLVYVNLAYWSLGLPAMWSKYFIFGASSLLSTCMGYSLAQTLSAALETPQAAFATWPLVLVTAANFAGFTVRLPAVKAWFRWLCDVSFCRWLYQIIVLNEFRDFDDGPKLLDLYFGEKRTTLAGTVGLALLFYAASLTLALFFLQPCRSRLRLVEKPPPPVVPAVAVEVILPTAAEEDGSPVEGAASSAAWGSGVAVRANPKDPALLEVSTSGNEDAGPLYYLDESTVHDSAVASAAGVPGDEESGLRAPLLRRGVHGNLDSVRGAGVREGSRLAFSDLDYYVYLRNGSGEANAEDGRNDARPQLNTSGGRVSSGERREAHVLRGVTGVVSPGQIMAILGPSGSGKTTLLDLLGGRKTPSVGRREGEIVVNGTLMEQGGGSFDRSNAYVMQDNVHHAALTVRQTLEFAAKLRMPQAATHAERHQRVEAMVTMLGLGGVLDTKVGDESKRGISGGEAKRLSIAVEAMDLPGMLLLDEPTSGLDASTALEVLAAVRGLADLGRTVVASLHQPSGEMFDMFDTCLLLTKSGHQAYFGKANRAMSYFMSIGLPPPPPAADVNPANFLLSVASLGSPANGGGPAPLEAGVLTSRTVTGGIVSGSGTADVGSVPNAPTGTRSTSHSEDTGDGLIVDLGVGHVSADAAHASLEDTHSAAGESVPFGEANRSSGQPSPPMSGQELEHAFKASTGAAELRAEAAAEEERARNSNAALMRRRAAEEARKRGSSTLWLSWVLTQRELKTTWQDRSRIVEAVGRHAFVGLFYGTLWWNLGPGRVYERVGVLFFSLVFVMLGNQQSIPKIFQERLMFYRERGAGVYGAVPYWWSIVIAQVPLATLTAMVYGCLVYWLAGLNNQGWLPFGYFLLTVVLCNLIALSFCQMLAAGTRVEDTAVSLFPVLLFFFIAFAGFIVRLPTLPSYLSAWAPTISFVRWSMEGLVINEFDGQEDKIFPVPEDIPIPPREIYQAFLDAYGFGKIGEGREILGRVLWILLANLVVIRIIGLVFLKYIKFERR